MLNEPEINKLLEIAGVKSPLAVFKYGSRVYGSITDKSDFDYIIIKADGAKEEYRIETELINISLISKDDFINDINNCEISALECLFLKPENVLLNNINTNFVLNKKILRHSISEKASHSFVKAKKKFIVQADKNIYAGKKSLFHSLRIIDFGIQLAKHSSIVDYSSANHLHKEIMDNSSENWDDYQNIYKPLYNNMMTEFRKLAPKE